MSARIQTGVHGAHGPEIIHERRVRGKFAVLRRQEVPRALAVEKVRLLEPAIRELGRKPFEKRAARGVCVRRPEVSVHLFYRRESLGVPFHFPDLRRFSRRIEVVTLEMHDISRQLVLRFAVFRFEAPDEDDREREVRETTDDLVHPARHTARDIREGPLQQQTDVGLTRARRAVGFHAAALLPGFDQ